MINRGLVLKSLLESLPLTAGFGLLLFIVEVGVSYIIPEFESEVFNLLVKMPFVQNLLTALLGTPVTEDLGTGLIIALPWVHPLVLLVVFGHQMTWASRLPAGEIDTGTIDVLLGLPVSRGEVFVTHALIGVVSGALVLVAGLAGHLIGFSLADTPAPAPHLLGIALTNALALYLSITGLGLFLSSVSERRGRAIGALVTLVVLSFLINFLAEYWAPARTLAPLSILTYYRPLLTLQAGVLPWGDIAILLSIGLTGSVAGAIWFRHRDIGTT